MIECTLSQLQTLLGKSEELDTAVRYLLRGEWCALPHGRMAIDGELVFLNRFSYETTPASDKPFETHFRYLDIHLLIAGSERVSVANPARLREYQRDLTEDYALANGDAEQTVPLRPGYALLIPPEEAHRTGEALDGVCTVEKAVCKVRWTPDTRLETVAETGPGHTAP